MNMTIGADASTSTIAFVEETEWGTIPTTPVWQNIRQTGNGLAPTINKVVSDEITASASVSDVIPTQGGAEGDINFEPSYGEWMDAVWEHSLRGTFDEYGVLKASNEYKQMSLERIVNHDGTPYYFRYPGARIGNLAITLDATATSPITATISVMAKEEQDDAAIVSGATYTAANSNPVMSMPELRAIDVEIEDVDKTACFTSLSMTVNNNLRSQQGKCTNVTSYPDLTAKGEGYGRREVTKDVGYYFNDLDFATMFQNNTEGSASMILSDGTRGYKITDPRFKILESSIPVDGNDADIIQTMTWQSLYDTTEATDLIIEKIPNLESGAAIKLTGDPITPSGLTGTYYYDGSTQENGENVYFSLNGSYAIWYDGTDTVVTTTSDVGVGATVYFEVATSTDPTGTWVAVTGTGTLTGAAYDPTA